MVLGPLQPASGCVCHLQTSWQALPLRVVGCVLAVVNTTAFVGDIRLHCWASRHYVLGSSTFVRYVGVQDGLALLLASTVLVGC